MRLLLPRILVLTLLSLPLLSGCTSPCLQLAAKICECQPKGIQRDECNQRASSEAAGLDLTTAQEDACEALVDKCDCTRLDTAEGKQACGLARTP